MDSPSATPDCVERSYDAAVTAAFRCVMERQGVDHRRSDERHLRLRDLGSHLQARPEQGLPVAGQLVRLPRFPDPGPQHERRRQLGAGAADQQQRQFLGDYEGLSSSGSTFYNLFVVTTGSASNRTDVMFRTVP
jgi:hypothetical protein